jgi:hypothetical protein
LVRNKDTADKLYTGWTGEGAGPEGPLAPPDAQQTAPADLVVRYTICGSR